MDQDKLSSFLVASIAITVESIIALNFSVKYLVLKYNYKTTIIVILRQNNVFYWRFYFKMVQNNLKITQILLNQAHFETFFLISDTFFPVFPQPKAMEVHMCPQ